MKNTNSRIWVTPRAREMGRKLIQRLQVRRGRGIAPYLNVEHFYTNYEAVYLWVDQMLTVHHAGGLTELGLQSAFIDAMPAEMSGTIN